MKTTLYLLVLLAFLADVARSQSASPSIGGVPPIGSHAVQAGGAWGLTAAEFRQINLARQKALQSDPELMEESQQLAQKMRRFQRKLDEAIVQADPNTKHVVDCIEKAQSRAASTTSASIPPSQVNK